ncbi:hypothetical protein [Gluconacetobacter tumulisoli]|uniref:Lipoprotein n=1 Tax=Gluconacetobacter tumulisoli TaxID=1286189 RepID=A0A7W4KAJ6_9PROT|nr:hypothetical protein [Gluconacetobacter tumulisoli]MBB2203312.1 hypothetical protein [Gluconacetobacter tumulisoli]
MERSVRRSMPPSVLCLLALAGCAEMEPYRKPYAWHPTGANAANLAAMVADPHDLERGHDAGAVDAQAPVLAVERLRVDRPKALPSTSGIASGVSGSGGSGGSGSGSGSGSGGSGGAGY